MQYLALIGRLGKDHEALEFQRNFLSGPKKKRLGKSRFRPDSRLSGPNRIDNLQNYCLGTRYGARSRSRLCRRLSISLVRYRHGLEKFLEHHFIPIRRRFNPHDLPTDLLRVQDPFFRGRRPIFSTGNDGAWPAMGTPSMAWHVLFLCGRSSLT